MNGPRNGLGLLNGVLTGSVSTAVSRAALSGLLLVGSAHAQLNFSASEVALGEWPEDVLRADMDGDGRADLIVPHWSIDAGRELLVYLQDGSGRFPSEPSRHVEIKPEIIAFAIAELRPDPGKELLLFTATQVFSLSSAIASYSGNLLPLFEWELAASVPDRRRVHYFPELPDMNGDGYSDLLLPGREAYGYFRGGPNESFTLTHSFSTVNEELAPSELPLGGPSFNTSMSINSSEGIVLSVEASTRSAFEDFLSQWDEAGQGSLLETSAWSPSAIAAPMNADAATDIVFMNIGNDLYGQLNVLLQNSDGGFASTADWRGPVETRGDFRLLDVNGDNLSDVLRVIDSGSDQDVQFFLNRGGQFDLSRPDQVMRFSGYDLNLSITDLANDGRPTLSASYYTIPVVNAVRNASIVRSQLLFASSATPGQIFNPRPDFKLDETFSATEIRGLSSQIHLQTDLDRDGRRDALYLTNEGALAAKAIDPALRFADTPFWQHVPTRTVLRFDVEDLNGDGAPDVLLYHSTSMTLLVSTP